MMYVGNANHPPSIPEMTASEPLSLDEEYVMQESWRDDDKSKFLVSITVGATATLIPLCLPIVIRMHLYSLGQDSYRCRHLSDLR